MAILPYIEQQELYNKFKLDEPWDSPHNKALLKEMPPIYRCPIRTKPEPFTTTYRVFVGKGALFEKDQRHRRRRRHRRHVEHDHGRRSEGRPFPGPSPTTCRSTRPRRLRSMAPARPIRAVSTPRWPTARSGFFKNTIDLKVFRALITRAAGEVVMRGAF